MSRVGEELTSFVGRDAELAELGRLFADGARVVTLTGIGGVGKTRLARRHARVEARAVLFCALAEASSVEAAHRVVAAALGVALANGDAGDDARAQLGRVLASLGPALVVLDNLEQVVGPIAAEVAAWAESAPGAASLVTSRGPLRIAGERTRELEPLGLDDAVSLLVARASDAGTAVPAQALDAARAIAQHLDGIPLAIELAAPRLSVLSP